SRFCIQLFLRLPASAPGYTNSTSVSPRSRNLLATGSPFPSYVGFMYSGSTGPKCWAALGTPAIGVPWWLDKFVPWKSNQGWGEQSYHRLLRS
uniref:Uncharacterized protein n=1 Tax=Aquila chrysaetos chrysaetos TaxID=223781 RepID=A0A663FIM2_AQUCH